jgi:hypothetical protein
VKKILILIFAFIFHQNAFSMNINASCISESGQSTFDIYFETDKNFGVFEYKFMGQDIIYASKDSVLSDGKIFGKAEFYSSRSGETKGNPFMFIFDINKSTFTELAEYKCSDIKD